MSFERVQRCLSLLRKFRQSGAISSKYSSSTHPPPITNEPVKFTTSEAAAWRAQYTSRGTRKPDPPLMQVISVTTSMMAFLLYFCFIREENDLDEMLVNPIYSSVDGLEETALKVALKQQLDRNGDTTEIVDRLEELKSQKSVDSAKAT